MQPSERIIIPLDVPSAERAAELVAVLRGRVGAFKVGLELVHSAGFEVFSRLRDAGAERIFYDCKLHDIPNTAAGAGRAIGARGLWMVNIHALGGLRMMASAVTAVREGAAAVGETPPLVIAVTLLTSLTALELADELRVDSSVVDYVTRLARLAQEAGCDGVVCSPREVHAVRWACGKDFTIVTPGIRPDWADAGDQRRITTPREAIERGSDYIVVGRPITGSADPAASASRVADEVAQARGAGKD